MLFAELFAEEFEAASTDDETGSAGTGSYRKDTDDHDA